MAAPTDCSVIAELRFVRSPSGSPSCCPGITTSNVNCTSSGRVKSLSIAEPGLTGPLPESLAYLSELESLSLELGVNMSLGIPASMSSLANLRYLSLWGNGLEGTIPDMFGNMSQLTYLSLSRNRISGTLPPSMTRLPKLETLHINENLLSRLPSDLSQLTSLKDFRFYDNPLLGGFPILPPNLQTCQALRPLQRTNPQQVVQFSCLRGSSSQHTSSCHKEFARLPICAPDYDDSGAVPVPLPSDLMNPIGSSIVIFGRSVSPFQFSIMVIVLGSFAVVVAATVFAAAAYRKQRRRLLAKYGIGVKNLGRRRSFVSLAREYEGYTERKGGDADDNGEMVPLEELLLQGQDDNVDVKEGELVA